MPRWSLWRELGITYQLWRARRDKVAGSVSSVTDARSRPPATLPQAKPGSPGLYLGMVRDQPFCFHGEEMGVTIGVAGAGKFTCAIAPNLLHWPGSAVVIDPKGQAAAVTAAARGKLGQNAFVLDPFRVMASIGVELPSVQFNPLAALDPKSSTVIADAKRLAEALIIAPTIGEAFFANSAKDLVYGLILTVVCNPGETASLVRVRQLLSAPAEAWGIVMDDADGTTGIVETVFEKMDAAGIPQAIECANRLHAMSERTRSSVIAEANSQLGFLDDPAIRDSLLGNDLSLSRLFTEKLTLYVVLPAEYLKSHGRWLRLVMSSTLAAAVQRRANWSGTPVLWLIDEAFQLGRMEEIPAAYALMRGYGVKLWTFWQDLGQLKSCYPGEWTSILANGFNQVLSVGDLDTAEYFAKLAGSTQETRLSWNSGQEGSGGSNQWEPKLRPERLLTMRRDQSYVKLPGALPDYPDRVPYYDQRLSDWKAAAAPDPYYKGL